MSPAGKVQQQPKRICKKKLAGHCQLNQAGLRKIPQIQYLCHSCIYEYIILLFIRLVQCIIST